MVVPEGDWDGEVRLPELRKAPQGKSTPLLMGESWPVWEKPTLEEEEAETEVDPVEQEPSQGDGITVDRASSESVLRLSGYCTSPSHGQSESK